jgi:hypothetical protein
MIAVLPAPGPHPSLGDRAALFDHFVGTWDTDYTFYAADGTMSRRSGEVLFGWIIDGRALQDIWISYPTDAERDLGTTVRFYDAKTATWRVVWVHPAGGIITTLNGGAVGDRIVLRGQGNDGSLLRWSFNDIQADSFLWRGETSHDSGETWRLTGECRNEAQESLTRRREATIAPSCRFPPTSSWKCWSVTCRGMRGASRLVGSGGSHLPPSEHVTGRSGVPNLRWPLPKEERL